ncbi:hypothetical protein NPIL_14711 [Nephila pilipes]|uniref:Uncharacterized protein n=1 Tax=Nephila pilipes TaxID=299642 RepID=A0A8X6Q6T8_NEPPI|nr:hypothetical protein NPIL_14711 [Nephila pilipes]
MPPGNTRFCLNLLQPSSKEEGPKVFKQTGFDTINLLSKDNMAVAYTDGSLNRGGAGVFYSHPDGSIYKHRINAGMIAFTITSEILTIKEALTIYLIHLRMLGSTEGLTVFSDSNSAQQGIKKKEKSTSPQL